MKIVKSLQYLWLKRHLSLLLAVFFLAIPIIQSFHDHHQTDVEHTYEQHISSNVEKCLICDYTTELKGKQALLVHDTAKLLPANLLTTLNTFVYTRIYKFTLQDFSNKGPPSLLS
jgi:hypothetical protein